MLASQTTFSCHASYETFSETILPETVCQKSARFIESCLLWIGIFGGDFMTVYFPQNF